jgi:hypothetical protein
MGLLEMMIRGAFLDGAVYRQAAADTGGNRNALIALLIPVAAGVLGGLLAGAGYFLGSRALIFLLVSALIGLLAAVGAIGLMAVCSQAVVRRKLDFGQLFRALAYAQSPGVLTIIPVVGWLLGLYRILTSLVAVREISGSDVVKSALLLAIGLVGTIVIGLILSPLMSAVIGPRIF